MMRRWLIPGIGVKRWLVLFAAGVFGLAVSVVALLLNTVAGYSQPVSAWAVLAFSVYSAVCVVYAL